MDIKSYNSRDNQKSQTMSQNHPAPSALQQRREGSSTVTLPEPVPVLQLRGTRGDRVQDGGPAQASPIHRRGVRWTEDVVDNEHMNKKKSKVCCIFHPQQNYDELGECDHSGSCDSPSSSSSSSSSESENEKEMDAESRRRARKERRIKKMQLRRSTSPNAYEVQPDYSRLKAKNANGNHS